MKYLFVTQLFPSGFTGTSVKTRNTIEVLLSMGHRVDVCCVHDKNLEKGEFKHKNLKFYIVEANQSKKNFFQILKRFFELIFTLVPFKIKRVFDKRLLNKINNLKKENYYDVIFFDGFTTLQYLSNKQINKDSIYIDDEDITDLFYKRMKENNNIFIKLFYFTEWMKSKNYERKYFRLVSKIWAISKRTACRLSLVKNKNISKKIVIIPTVIPIKQNVFNIKSKHLIFTGTLNWPENVAGLKWFVSECWPKLNLEFPKSKLLITGQMPDDNLLFLENYSNIELLGFVPDLADAYKQSAIGLSPIFINSGIKIKILTYLSYGLPVVAIDQSTNGLVSIDGIIKAKKHDFIDKIIILLKNNDKRNKISKKAKNNIKKNYSNKVLEEFFNEQLFIK